MSRLLAAILDLLLPPSGEHRAADSEHHAADEPTMTLPRITDPGPLVRPFYADFERGLR